MEAIQIKKPTSAKTVSLDNFLLSVDRPKLLISDKLSKLLADTYALYLKTQNYHWNVKGPNFLTLHELFEVQYTEMASSIDEIAEQISAMGYAAPGSFSAFASLTDIECETEVPTDKVMIKRLLEDNMVLAFHAKSIHQLASEMNDETTADMMTRRIVAHEKNIWMLNALIT